jgi:alkylation response protein AidB-like acyl-CoA dehydrogenase
MKLCGAHGYLLPCCKILAAGETTATFAWVEDNGRWDAEGTALTATAESGEIVLNGHKSYVVDGHTADLIVVLARAPQGLSMFTVDGNAPGLTRRPLKSMDPTRKFARLKFNRVAARPLGTAGGAAAPFARTMVEAAVCLANEMVGGADRLREDALAYAMMRMQFGKPIASFQSMKHKQADMLLEVELAKAGASSSTSCRPASTRSAITAYGMPRAANRCAT